MALREVSVLRRPTVRGGLVGGGLALLTITGLVLGADPAVAAYLGLPLTLALSFAPLAVFVLHHLPGHPVGRLMLGTGSVAALAVLAISWSRWTPAAWLAQWLWWPPFGFIPLTLLVFPSGQLPSRRWRPVASILIVAAAVATLALAWAATVDPHSLLTSVVRGAAPSPVAVTLARVALLAIVLDIVTTVAVCVSLVRRWKSALSLERRQIACLAPSAALFSVSIGLGFAGVEGAWIPAVVGLPIGFALAVLQYQLFDLDLVVHRGFVWIVLTAGIVGLYALSVAGLDAVIDTDTSWTSSLVAGAVVAAALTPLERLAQRAGNRLLYGRREDPYAVLVQAGRHVEAIQDPLQVMPRLAGTLVDTLRVPYARIELTLPGQQEALLFSAGRPTGEPLSPFPMVAHGAPVGTLLVSPRHPGARFTAAETRLLHGLAAQAAMAAEACRASLDLQRARERLVLAREEERRRLRNDLHDGVASALVAARMLTAVAVAGEALPDATRHVLQTLNSDLAVCSAEVRSLIDGLRPPALDRGLADALRSAAESLAPAVDVAVVIDGDLDDLPAAVEVVALRVVSEALTNVAKHARARTGTVTVTRTDAQLAVTVSDDGIGLAPTPEQTATAPAVAVSDGSSGGVGLDSIRARVAEVGGSLALHSSRSGLVVEVVLPARRGVVSATSAAGAGQAP